MAAKKKPGADEELAQLKANPDARAIATALASAHSRVVAAAAELIKARQLSEYTAALQSAYARFLVDPVKRDPGCRAKLAILEALDFTESMSEDPFLSATSLQQLEAAWGPPVDTAAGCRGRAILALARIGHQDAVPLAGLLLADDLHLVRVAAADALGHSGVRAAAGVLLHKLETGDEEPEVVLACMSGALALVPELMLGRLAAQLADGSDEGKEVAALALGQSNRPDALRVLVDAAEATVMSSDRAVILRAMGLHRSDAALEALLKFIAGDNLADARAAVRALATRRFEAGVRQRVQHELRGRPELERELAESFAD
ncbi:MAG: HEAT repeat domain-containing protein [Deltaproteobacteria bacterium]|nr:HEAT repeat domain-containing protein [Deltaproteobacteria bacterium]